MSRVSRTTRLTARTAVAAGLAAGLVLGTQVAPAAAAVNPAPNPDLVVSCGLDVVLAIDASFSIKSSEQLSEMKQTMNGLVKAFADKNTRVGVVTFNSTAKKLVPLTLASTQSTAAGGVHREAIYNYKSAWGTNWQQGLEAIQDQFASSRPGVSKLAVFVSDGAPNLKGNETALPPGKLKDITAAAIDAAIPVANALKGAGVHMLGIGTGKALGPNGTQYEDALKKVSGPDVMPPAAPDARKVDLVMQENLTTLESQFRQLAQQTVNAPGCSFLSMQLSPASLPPGRSPVTATAQLATSGGTVGIANQTVAIQTRSAGTGAWTTLRTAKTDGSGRLTAQTSTKKNREFRAVFAGGGGYNPVTSATVTAVVHPKVKTTLSTRRSGKATIATFAGKVKPKKAVKRVFLQKRVHGVWDKQGKAKIRAKGKYSITEVMTRKGKWRVYVKATTSYGDGHSKVFKIKA